MSCVRCGPACGRSCFRIPLASLDPRMTVLEILSEPLRSEFRPDLTSHARGRAPP